MPLTDLPAPCRAKVISEPAGQCAPEIGFDPGAQDLGIVVGRSASPRAFVSVTQLAIRVFRCCQASTLSSITPSNFGCLGGEHAVDWRARLRHGAAEADQG